MEITKFIYDGDQYDIGAQILNQLGNSETNPPSQKQVTDQINTRQKNLTQADSSITINNSQTPATIKQNYNAANETQLGMVKIRFHDGVLYIRTDGNPA